MKIKECSYVLYLGSSNIIRYIADRHHLALPMCDVHARAHSESVTIKSEMIRQCFSALDHEHVSIPKDLLHEGGARS